MLNTSGYVSSTSPGQRLVEDAIFAAGQTVSFCNCLIIFIRFLLLMVVAGFKRSRPDRPRLFVTSGTRFDVFLAVFNGAVVLSTILTAFVS